MGLRQVLMGAYLIRKNKKERERWWEFQGRCPGLCLRLGV